MLTANDPNGEHPTDTEGLITYWICPRLRRGEKKYAMKVSHLSVRYEVGNSTCRKLTLPVCDRPVPNNISKYNYRDRMYKVDPPGPGDHLAMHLALEGCALFREGDEAKLQAAAEEKRKAAADEARKEAQKQVSRHESR